MSFTRKQNKSIVFFNKSSLLHTVLTLLLLLAFPAFLTGCASTEKANTTAVYEPSGEKLGKIAILPFTGGSSDENDGIAELLAFTDEMTGNFGVIPRTGITSLAMKEQAFQAASGMTDPDTIARLGEQFGAQYVMAGSITKLGTRNLLIVSIVHIEKLQQVAGDFLEYDTLDELNRNENHVRTMSAKLVDMVRNPPSAPESGEKQMLALLPVDVGDTNKLEGDALSQLLSIHLLSGGMYEVYPRTQIMLKAREETKIQQVDGVTRSDEAVKIGGAVNPPFVLSIVSRRIAAGTRFFATITNIQDGTDEKMEDEQYENMNYGINAMDFLAQKLNGNPVSDKEREKRNTSVRKQLIAREKAEAARIAEYQTLDSNK